MSEQEPMKSPIRVLLVDDEKSVRVTLASFLKDADYDVAVAEDARGAQERLREGEWDVVVSDIVLPRLSGVALLKHIRETAPDVQVVMMTGEPTVDTASEAVRAGACDYLSKPIGKDGILRAVANAARIKRLEDERRRLTEENAAYQRDLERLVHERTRKMEEALANWKAATEGTVMAMAAAVESRDPYTAGHQQRVAQLARAIAQAMQLPPEKIDAVYHAALIHDLGKISVPAEILANPGRLCDEAMSLIKKHPKSGSRILRNVKFPWPVDQIILQHHERLDGSGYPQGLRDEEILQEARILAVADVVEAMASHRPYRPSRGIEAALAEIDEGRGTRYDPVVADTCLRLFNNNQFTFETAVNAMSDHSG